MPPISEAIYRNVEDDKDSRNQANRARSSSEIDNVHVVFLNDYTL